MIAAQGLYHCAIPETLNRDSANCMGTKEYRDSPQDTERLLSGWLCAVIGKTIPYSARRYSASASATSVSAKEKLTGTLHSTDLSLTSHQYFPRPCNMSVSLQWRLWTAPKERVETQSSFPCTKCLAGGGVRTLRRWTPELDVVLETLHTPSSFQALKCQTHSHTQSSERNWK